MIQNVGFHVIKTKKGAMPIEIFRKLIGSGLFPIGHGLYPPNIGNGLFPIGVTPKNTKPKLGRNVFMNMPMNLDTSKFIGKGLRKEQVISGVLLTVLPIIASFLAKKGIKAIDKIFKSKSKKDDIKLEKEIVDEISKLDLGDILKEGKISGKSKGILDRIIKGSGIGIL